MRFVRFLEINNYCKLSEVLLKNHEQWRALETGLWEWFRYTGLHKHVASKFDIYKRLFFLKQYLYYYEYTSGASVSCDISTYDIHPRLLSKRETKCLSKFSPLFSGCKLVCKIQFKVHSFYSLQINKVFQWYGVLLKYIYNLKRKLAQGWRRIFY